MHVKFLHIIFDDKANTATRFKGRHNDLSAEDMQSEMCTETQLAKGLTVSILSKSTKGFYL